MCYEFVVAHADFCLSGYIANVYALRRSTYLGPYYVWHITSPYPACFLDFSPVSWHLAGPYTHIGVDCSEGLCRFRI